MSKTWHDKKTRESFLKGREHEHNAGEGVCMHCGKKSKGGLEKRKRASMVDAIERAVQNGKYTGLTHLLDMDTEVDNGTDN